MGNQLGWLKIAWEVAKWVLCILLPLVLIFMALVFQLVAPDYVTGQECGGPDGNADSNYKATKDGGPNMTVVADAYGTARTMIPQGDPYAQNIMLALFEAGLAESGFRNLSSTAVFVNGQSLDKIFPGDPPPGHDGTSVGFLQQQVGADGTGSFGWGNWQQATNPAHAAQMFLKKAIANAPSQGSAAMLAQSVHASAFSNGSNYSAQESAARGLINKAGGMPASQPTPAVGATQLPLTPAGKAPAGTPAGTALNPVDLTNAPASCGTGAGAGLLPGQLYCANSTRGDGATTSASGVKPGACAGGAGHTFTMPSSGEEAKVINAAIAKLGTPYSWGGGSFNGPSRGIDQGAGTVGFDCSGLVQYAIYQGTGTKVARTAADQYHDPFVSPESAAHPSQGDLLFWDNPIGHVAIFLGSGLVIQAPSTGDVVKISPVWGSPLYGHPHYKTTPAPAPAPSPAAPATPPAGQAPATPQLSPMP